MIRSSGDRVEVEGAMTLPSATALLNEGSALIAQGKNIVDLAAVTEVDSSGLSVVFGWLRAARDAGQSLRIANPPENFMSLAEVYGVADQLPLA
jgi:phospholipid transport system transporter-binding protein